MHTRRMSLGTFLVIGIFCCLKTQAVLGSGIDVTNTLNKIFNSSYDKRIRPGLGESPLEIGVTMYVITVRDFSEKEERMTTEFYFRQSWIDPRLDHNILGTISQNITGNSDLDDMIWKPDTFLPGTRANLRSNEHVFVRIASDGSILRSVMIRATTDCPVNLKYFPYDTQICPLEFESYGFTAKDIIYIWSKGQDSVGFYNNFEVEDKRLTDMKTSVEFLSLSTGNYSRLKVDLVFVRSPGGHFFRSFYGPAIIFTIVTYMTFFLPVAFASFRGLSLLISVVSHWVLVSKASEDLPKIDYSTRLDHYLITCLILSVISLIEFLVVILLQKPFVGQKVAPEDFEMQANEKKSMETKLNNNLSSYLSRSAKYFITIRQHRRGHEKLDLMFRVLFAVVFIIYNLWYWVSLP